MNLFKKGKGWHKQTLRHSNARKLGKAGGIYASNSSNPRRRGELITVGELTVKLKSLTLKQEREKAAFERVIMSTSNYKRLQRQGWPKNTAISKAMQEKGIVTKRGTKWFSVSNLSPNLKKRLPKQFKKDSDKDGVPDIVDCKPLNPKKHQIGTKIKETITFIIEKEKTKAAIKTLEKKEGESLKKLQEAKKRKDFTEIGKREEELKEIKNNLVSFKARLEFFK